MRLSLNNKVSSFSMIEMLVVLILSSIVVGIIYVAFLTVSRYQTNLTGKYRATEDVSSIYFLLQKDFERSETITRTEENSLECSSSLRASVVYTFNNDAVVRHQSSRIDTFRCEIGKPVFRMEGKELETTGVIDELLVEVKCLPYHVNWTVYKKYDAAGLVKPTKSDSIQ